MASDRAPLRKACASRLTFFADADVAAKQRRRRTRPLLANLAGCVGTDLLGRHEPLDAVGALNHDSWRAVATLRRQMKVDRVGQLATQLRMIAALHADPDDQVL